MDALTRAGLIAVRSLARKREPSVRRAMEDFPDVLTPALAEIERTYPVYMLRPPTAADVEAHLRCLRAALPDMEDARRAVREGSLRRYLGIRPLKLEMDVVNQCNLRCVMCHFSNPEFYRRRKEDLAPEAFARIADQVFPLCSQVSLSISTEPLMHRGLAGLLERLPAYRVPWVYLHTNGQLLDEAIIERFIATGFNQLSISIDAATQATYERIRVGGKFSRLLDNLAALNRAKREHGSSLPRLFFNVVLMRSNIRELPAIVRLAREHEVTGVAAVHLMPFEQAAVDAERESLAADPELCNRMLDEAAALAVRLGVHIALPQRFGALRARVSHRDLTFLRPGDYSAPEACCPFPWHFVGISAAGSVAPCGWWHSEPLGNIHEEPFEAMWTRAFAGLRREHQRGELRPNCQTCPSAGRGSVDDPSTFAVRRIYR